MKITKLISGLWLYKQKDTTTQSYFCRVRCEDGSDRFVVYDSMVDPPHACIMTRSSINSFDKREVDDTFRNHWVLIDNTIRFIPSKTYESWRNLVGVEFDDTGNDYWVRINL